MKVKDLVNELLKYDQEAEVIIDMRSGLDIEVYESTEYLVNETTVHLDT